MDKISVLCIDDDPVIQTLVKEVLAPWRVISCLDLESVKVFLTEQHMVDAIIIDIDLPDGDGLRFLNQQMVKFKNQEIPIFVISGYTDISKKMMAFEFGVDDFLTKPFDPLEFKIRLQSRVKKIQQRRSAKTVGDVVIDSQQFKAYAYNEKSEEVDLLLTSLEMKILVLLTERMERIFTREQIMDIVWGDVSITDRTVDSHVAHLRKKLKDTKIQIITAQNVGYSAALKK